MLQNVTTFFLHNLVFPALETQPLIGLGTKASFQTGGQVN